VTGTPSKLFGLLNTDNRKFSVLAIDIHTIKDNKLDVTHHVVDWNTAIKHLKTDKTFHIAADELMYNPLEAQQEDLQARAERIVRPFYECLTRPQDKEVDKIVKAAVADNWLSFSGKDGAANENYA